MRRFRRSASRQFRVRFHGDSRGGSKLGVPRLTGGRFPISCHVMAIDPRPADRVPRGINVAQPPSQPSEPPSVSEGVAACAARHDISEEPGVATLRLERRPPVET